MFLLRKMVNIYRKIIFEQNIACTKLKIQINEVYYY